MTEDATIEKRVGLLIRQVRIERGLSIRELARLAGADASSISRVECGEQQPSIMFVFKLCEVFDIPLTHFMEQIINDARPEGFYGHVAESMLRSRLKHLNSKQLQSLHKLANVLREIDELS